MLVISPFFVVSQLIMPECAIVSCKNANKLYSLPESPALRAAWLEKINRLNYVPTANTRVCEVHFDSNAFIPDEENKDKKNRVRKKRTLKPRSVPTLFLKTAKETSSEKKTRAKRTKIPNPKHVISPTLEMIPSIEKKSKVKELQSYARVPDLEDKSCENEIDFDAKSIFSQVQIKCEPESDQNVNNDINFSINPWDVSNASDFLSYCCPECDFKSGELLEFSQHAVSNHVLSHNLFSDDPLFDANLDSYDSYIDPSVEHIEEVHEETKSSFLNKENSLIDSNIEHGINPGINSKKSSNQADRKIIILVEKEETMESETNIEKNSNEKKLNVLIQLNDFPKATVNLENQSEESGKKLEKKETAICEICGFKTNPQGLLQHVKMLHEKNFICSYCEVKFPTKHNLEYHIEAKHPGTSEMKYFCSECGDGFMFERNMTKHREKHKDIDEEVNKKAHKCSKCGKRFAKGPSLRRHIKRVHGNQKESLQKQMEAVPVNLNDFSKNAQNIFKESLDTSGNKNDYSHEKEAKLLKMDPSDDKIENSNEKVSINEGKTEVQNLDKTNQLCAKCGQHFTSLIDLVHHFFKEHKKPGEDFDCPMCPKIISLKCVNSKASVIEHIRNTHLQETKKCPDCKQILKLGYYKQHRRNVHGIYSRRLEKNPTPAPNSDGQYECPACKKVLSTKGSKYVSTLR